MTSMTGVEVAEDAIQAFMSWKIGRKNPVGFITFQINDEKTHVVIDQQGPQGATFDDFCGSLAIPDVCRYGVFLVHYEGQEGLRTKTGFFVWCPDSAPIKMKTLYAGTKDTVKRVFEGVQFEVQANDFDDLDFAQVLDKCNKQFT